MSSCTTVATNHVVHLSRWWNPAVEDQATDRVFRIGQTKDVFVHIPMAIHPEPALGKSSFDLRLDALMERKRALTRDLFLPPEATDADLTGLFEDVSLSRSLDPSEVDSQATEPSAGIVGDEPVKFTSPATTHQAAPASRPILTLPTVLEKTGARVWVCGPREARPTDEILALFRGKIIRRATISDPYALASEPALPGDIGQARQDRFRRGGGRSKALRACLVLSQRGEPGTLGAQPSRRQRHASVPVGVGLGARLDPRCRGASAGRRVNDGLHSRGRRPVAAVLGGRALYCAALRLGR